MDGIDWTASAMRAARTRLEIAAANLANASSDGFRRAAARVSLTAHGLAVDREVSSEQGALRPTGRVLDLAIVGPGIFSVGGTTTRDGAFVRDAEGFLADDRGRRVRGTHGPVRVDPDGRLRDAIPLPPGSQLQTGALESPNVNAIGEMVAVLDAQRAFETAQKALGAIDEARAKSVNDVARVR
jgi:flagellar basal body rod protein FlgG